MSTPQQPEIARSRRSEVTAEVAAKGKAEIVGLPVDPATGPIPEDNQPGHHPPVEQDKPQGPPPEPKARAPKAKPKAKKAKEKQETAERQRFPFAVDSRIASVARLVGITPERAAVEVGGGALKVRFGPWALETPLDNVESVSHARISRGWPTLVARLGGLVRIRFREPVSGALPFGLFPGRTLVVAVEEPDDLVVSLLQLTD
jgi:hypothetical protein